MEQDIEIKDIEGIGTATAKKLKEGGYNSVFDLAAATAEELHESTGISKETASTYIIAALKLLRESNIIDKEFITATEILEQRKKVIKCTTGSNTLDELLKGGIETQAVTEFYGEFGCLSGNSKVIKDNGSIVDIKELGNNHLQNIDHNLVTMGNSIQKATTFFKYENAHIIEIITSSGKSISGTYNHPVYVKGKGWTRLDQLKENIDEIQVITNITSNISEYVTLNYIPKINKFGPKFKGKIPEIMDEKLAGIIGFIMADGWLRANEYRFGYGLFERKMSLENKLMDMIKFTFNLNPKIYKIIPKDYNTIIRKENGKRYEYNSQIITKLLKQLTNNKQEIPKEIFQSKNSVVASFISWLFSGDGSVIFGKRGHRGIFLSNKNLTLLRDVQLLLLRFGIISKIHQNTETQYQLSIRQKQSMIDYINNIGFQDKLRTTKLKKLKNDIQCNVSYSKTSQEKNTFEKVKKIIYHEDLQTVYDLEVPTNHSFIANGIISHNSGKSQICHTLCALAQQPIENKGFGGSVIYIDTEGTYRSERVQEIAQTRNLDVKSILDNIRVTRANTSSHFELIVKDLGKYINQFNAKLIIVDSIIALHRSEFMGRGTLSDRQQRLNRLLHKLNNFAHIYNVAIVITNQVQSSPDTFFGDPTKATGGNIIGHASTYRIYLRKSGDNRIAKTIDSPYHPYADTRFTITEKGVEDIEEKTKKNKDIEDD